MLVLLVVAALCGWLGGHHLGVQGSGQLWRQIIVHHRLVALHPTLPSGQCSTGQACWGGAGQSHARWFVRSYGTSRGWEPAWGVVKVWILRCMADSTRCSCTLLAYSFHAHMFKS